MDGFCDGLLAELVGNIEIDFHKGLSLDRLISLHGTNEEESNDRLANTLSCPPHRMVVCFWATFKRNAFDRCAKLSTNGQISEFFRGRTSGREYICIRTLRIRNGEYVRMYVCMSPKNIVSRRYVESLKFVDVYSRARR